MKNKKVYEFVLRLKNATEEKGIKSGENKIFDTNPLQSNINAIEEKKKELRQQREKECFSIVNRGQVWYEQLTIEEKLELYVWYKNWLNVTDNLQVPVKPKWIK